MTTIIVRHKVSDFAQWKSFYDSVDSFHKAQEVKSAQVFQSADNPNEVIILSELENLSKARQFAQSQGLKDAMQKAGVADKPDVYFVEKIETRKFT